MRQLGILKIPSLHEIEDVFVILISRLTDNQIEFPAMSRIEIRAKKYLTKRN